MSDISETGGSTDEKPFVVDRPKQGRAACKKCKQKCLSGELRIARLVTSPFGSGKMKNWYHVECIFEQFLKQRQTTKRIESGEDVEGWDDLSDEDKYLILNKVEECDKQYKVKYGVKTTVKKQKGAAPKMQNTSPIVQPSSKHEPAEKKNDVHKDHLFREFRRLVANISNVNSYTEKTALVRQLFTKGSDEVSFKGDITLWCRLLLPGVIKRIYNLKSKQIIKLFSQLFWADQNAMLEHLESGDIGETIRHFFDKSSKIQPAAKSQLTLQEVDEFLEELSKLTKEEEQLNHFKSFAGRCTSNDMKIIVRLIKGDLRMKAGPKHILEGIHPDAYSAYQASRDLDMVINRCLERSGDNTLTRSSSVTSVAATVSIMTPVLPMLADACKSVEQAMKKCPNGMYSEIKYDGERVQVHKYGSEFKYFSRSLKPVMPHKVAHFKDFIPKAFPHGKDLILDSEILLVDTTNGKPLPFGSLGKHKKTKFKEATVCLFVFDCIYYNGEDLTTKPISERKRILRENMTEIPNHVMFSEMQEIHKPDDLSAMITKVLKLGLEGLVLKDLCSIYEPGKRHWLKIKKDYLFDGAMADSADLIVLGAWYGTGKKGGMMSVFLMGCYNAEKDHFCTVTKVHTGHDDKTLEKLQNELNMIKISCDPSKVPTWLRCTKTMIPDFVAVDPKAQPVWEITGAQFTQQHDVHTADGISIRFPRVTKIREDKTWTTATSLGELKELYRKSNEHTDVSLLMKSNNALDSNKNYSGDTTDNKQSNSVKRKYEQMPETSETKTAKKSDFEENIIKKPLPSIFETVQLLLEDPVKQKQGEWVRYFIAYGGTIVPPDQWEQATHVLHLKDTIAEPCVQAPRTAVHVILEWIVDSVSNKFLQDYKPYCVRWKPSLKNSDGN